MPAVFLVVLPLTLGHQERWPAWSFACIALGCALAVVFFRTERAVAAAGGDPLLRVSVLRSPGLLSGLGATSAADASGLLTTAIQLGQAVGVAAFGGLFLTLDSRAGTAADVSGHATAVTLVWVALATGFGVLAAVPLTRTVLAARRASPMPQRLSV